MAGKIVTFVSAERLRNTTFGNPRLRLTTTEGDVYQIQDNAQLGYQTFFQDTRYELTLSRAGRITHAKALDPTKGKGVVI